MTSNMTAQPGNQSTATGFNGEGLRSTPIEGALLTALRAEKSPLRGREIRISVWDKPTKIAGLVVKEIRRPVIAAFKRHRRFPAGGILEFTDRDGRDFAVADQDIEAGRIELDYDGKLPAKAEMQ